MCDMQNFKDMLYDNALLYPCLDCKKDKQEGNPYYWQTSCYDCKKERDWKIKMANISIELIKNSVMKGKLK